VLAVVAAAWAFPLALMTAELATAMPTNGGPIDWARRGLGFVATCCMSASLLFNQVFDLPLYTVLMSASLQQLLRMEDWQAAAVRLTVVAVALVVNVVGLDMVTSSTLVLTLLILIPFAIMPVVAATLRQPFTWAALGPASIPSDFQGSAGVFVASVLWNMQGWSQLGNVAAEIQDPQRSYPRGLLLALAAVTAMYAYSVAFGSALQPNPGDWDDSFLVQVGTAVAPWLGYCCGVGAAAAAFSLYVSNLACYSRGLQAMVRCGALPLPCLGWDVPRFGTPVPALVALTLSSAVLSFFDLSSLVVLDTAFNNISIALVTAAFLALRHNDPGLARPFRAPGGATGAAIMAACVAGFVGVSLYAVALSESLGAAFLPLGAIASLAVLVAAEQRCGAFAAATACCRCSRTGEAAADSPATQNLGATTPLLAARPHEPLVCADVELLRPKRVHGHAT